MMADDYGDKLKKTHVVYLHETVRESWARNMGTALTILALWSLGAYANSPALEWLGVFMAIILIGAKIVARIKGAVDSRMTPDQAREWLDQQFPKT